MTKELIEQINSKLSESGNYEQGIYFQPYGVPYHIKEHVIYSRYETGGVSGGSCWDWSNPQPYTVYVWPKDKHMVLDMVLKELCPNISYLQFKEIEALWHDNYETEYEYYGNSTDWHIDYIILSELEELISTFS